MPSTLRLLLLALLLSSLAFSCDDENRHAEDTLLEDADVASDQDTADPPDVPIDLPDDDELVEPPPTCHTTALPQPASVWLDEVHSAGLSFRDSDLAFDSEGNALSIDQAGNLVRRTHDGAQELWLADVALTARGLAYLSTGELIVADSGRGMLLTVYPNQELRTLVAHLDAPTGLEVDQQDRIYVSELTRAAIVEVDPRTGSVRTAALGLRVVPNGLAFSPDFATLYAAADNGALYSLTHDADGTLGPLVRLGSLPYAAQACDGKNAGDECQSDGETGSCELEAGELVCRLPGSCTGREVGAPCEEWGNVGTCQDDGGSELICQPIRPCDGLVSGDPCTEWDLPGTCQDDGSGELYCRPAGPCDGLVAGALCDAWGMPGTCRDFGNGTLECAAISTCASLNPGDYCQDFGNEGVCDVDFDGVPYCRPTMPCDGKLDGDACTQWGQAGHCRPDGGGGLFCRQVSACDALSLGDACVEYEQAGTCQDDGSGYLSCWPVPPCEGKQAGDTCDEYGRAGRCTDDGYGSLLCFPFPPCHGLVAGDACDDWGTLGLCEDDGAGSLWCRPILPCDDKNLGDACEEWGQAGFCQDDGWGALYCRPTLPCDFKVVGDACVFWDGAPGVCGDGLWGVLDCQAAALCAGLLEGDPCVDSNTGMPGSCAPSNTPDLMCKLLNPCDALPLGSPCVPMAPVDEAFCAEGQGGLTFCRPAQPCDGKLVGTRCTTEWGVEGVCIESENGLLCLEAGACAMLGATCTTEDGTPGLCEDGGKGNFNCVEHLPCDGLEVGAACADGFGAVGVCIAGESGPICLFDPACKGKNAGADCVNRRSRLGGTCAAAAGGALVCQPKAPCAERGIGESCELTLGIFGACAATTSGALWCDPAGQGGRSVAITTDACGNVYLADEYTQALWRFAPSGGAPQLVAQLGLGPVTGMAWGSGVGEWDLETLYLSIGGGGSLLQVELGFPGHPLVTPLRTDSVPQGPAVPPAIDCLHLPAAPLESNELVRPVGYHDVAFDQDGFIIGSDGFNLVAVDHDDNVMLYAPGLTGAQGMDWLDDGSLIVACDQGIVRVLPNGAQVVLAADLLAYGVTVGPDGKIYVADNSRIYRLDPRTDPVELTTYLDPGAATPAFGARAIAFDVDASLMVIASFGEWVYTLTLDENLDPVGSPRPFAHIRSGATFLDGLGIDACGNVYVPNYEYSALYRAMPDGRSRLYLQWPMEKYGHGLEWGSGVGGWRTDALYLPQPYDNNTVQELVIGVPSNR